MAGDNKTPAAVKKAPSARRRLIEAGVDIFGRHGFEAATTRMLATQAEVNIAAIPYYFNGKEGLYHAVVAHISGKVEAQVKATLKQIDKRTAAGDLGREESLDLLEKLLGDLISFMVGSPEAHRVAKIILREQLYPSSAYDGIFSRLMSPVIDAIARLVAAASGEASLRIARLRAMALMGQVMAFRVARETMVRALGLEGYNSSETAEIRDIILEHTKAVVRTLAGTRQK